MFFILSKVFQFLLSPIIWIIIVLVLGLFFSKWRKKSMIYALLIFFVFGNGFLFDEVCRWYEYPHQKIATEPYDLAIVLGGYSSYNQKDNIIEFHEASDRFIYGFYLLKNNHCQQILFSGGSGSLVGLDQEGKYIYPFLQELGIRKNKILVDSLSRNTYENALFSKQMLNEMQFTGNVVLITSALHMPRALACFKKVGLEVVPFPVDRISGDRKFYFDHLLIPNTQNLHLWQRLLHEWLGTIVYWLKGYAA